MRFDLTDMRLFLNVVETGSLTKGARATHLALASVSERIAGMEDEVGAPLLERNPRGVTTTPAGDAVVRHARDILGRVEQMRGELSTYATGLKGRVRLLSNTAALASFLPARLCRFLAAHPDLSVDLEERRSIDVVRALAEGQAELGIVADTVDLGALQTRLVARDHLVVIVPHGHRLAAQPRVTFADVLAQPIVGVADAALELYLAERASRFGMQLNYRVQLRRAQDVVMHVEAGIGVSIVSDALADRLQGNITVLPLDEAWAARKLLLCARDFSTLTPAAELLFGQLMTSLPEAAIDQ